MLKHRVKRLAPGEIDALMANHPMPERAHPYREWVAGDVDAVQGVIARFNEILARMERALAGGPWLCGDDFSLADVAMIPFVDRVERVKARPSDTPSATPEGFHLTRPDDEAITRVMSV